MFTAAAQAPPLYLFSLTQTLGRTFLTDSNIADEFYRGRRKNLLTLTAGKLNSEPLPKEKNLESKRFNFTY